MRIVRVLAALVAFSLGIWVPSRAAEPAHVTFSPVPPGTVVQSQLVYLSGQAMNSQWRAVLSKNVAGKGSGTTFYQYYLSIYHIDGSTYKLKYRSPQNGPLDTVEKAHGAPMWFPLQTASIVGVGQFMQPSVEQLVVASHQTGADCGSANITVFAYDSKTQKVGAAISLQNGCDLTAKIVNPGAAHGLSSLALSGPYYAPSAAMCCPTKNKASATLAYRNGKWVETPQYYTLYLSGFPK